MGRIEQYRAELRRLTDWEPYLKKNSGLPGARANLELVAAVGEEADAERLWRRKAKRDTRKEVASEATSIQSGDT